MLAFAGTSMGAERGTIAEDSAALSYLQFIEDGDLRAAQLAWRHNNARLRNELTGLSFFGMHGRGWQALNDALQQRSGLFQLVTFYDIQATELRVLQLLDAAQLAATYAFRNRGRPGAVMVFDLDAGGGHYTQSSVQQIAYQANWFGSLPDDTEAERRMMAKVLEEQEKIQQVSAGFSRADFDRRFVGVIPFSAVELYQAAIERPTMYRWRKTCPLSIGICSLHWPTGSARRASSVASYA